jgi:single-stranded DNA-specific DHH superfamily exonuclease
MFPDKIIAKIKDELDNCQSPLIFYDDDADGLCSFLLFYRYKKEGRGVPVKSKPSLGKSFLRKVEEFGPDKIIVLDVPMVEQEFLDGVDVPVVWVDHHTLVDLDGITVYNPKQFDEKDNSCITRICYEVVQQDQWIAAVGAIADWQMPEWMEDFAKKHPELIDQELDIGKLYFDSTLGKLIRVFAFILKGDIKEVNKCVKILTRIEDSQEILQQSSPQGKYLWKRYETNYQAYEKLLKQGHAQAKEGDEFLIYIYPDSETSFTGDLSNELKYRHADKVVIVGREVKGEVRMSLRSEDRDLAAALEKALVGVEGYGGGHMHACGACVKKRDFDAFVAVLREELC